MSGIPEEVARHYGRGGLLGRILAALTDEKGRPVETEKLLEVDFSPTGPVRAGDQFCFGEVR